jgi:LmbE family N-acetylglucosaminyl deacetylase/glycosyltransferase involved in cell wall biosynthesis
VVLGILRPPGEASRVRADRTLVIAPHFDDDVLGCGGLLAQLAASGSEIAVLYLTDGSGGEEQIADRAAYAARRHEEALLALEILGVREAEFADIRDGSLADHLDQAADAIRNVLRARRPDLLLAISPLEVSSDHRAAFAALHAVLSPLRGGSDLDDAVENMEILLYEANHPAFPDVLVDVTAEIDLVRKAIEAHQSQLELHNYREVTLGLRQLRTASLSPAVMAAEGYRRLSVDDFRMASRASMIRQLGGVPELHDIVEGPAVSVVVRTKDRPEMLAQALQSLAEGSYRRVEIVLVNDGGASPVVPADYPFPVVRVDLEHNRGRAGAANAGIEAASGDWVGFLDDDDLAQPEHLATLAGLSTAAGARVVYSDAAVGIYELDPESGWREVERRLPYSRDFDPDLLLFDNYIPFNTVLIERRLLLAVGRLDTDLPFFEDWDLLIRLSEAAPFHHLRQVTAEYRHFRSGSQHVFGEYPRARSDFLSVKAKVLEKHRHRQTPDVLARVIDRLRAETVGAFEAAARRRAELTAERQRIETHRHALNVELAGHRRTVDEQSAHIERLHAEVARLTRLVAEMEGTKAWRLHRTLEKLRGK